MNNILVITDNITLYERVKNVFSKNQRKNINVTFRHSSVKSPIWNHIDKLDSINVKKETEWIISNFNLVISIHCFQLFPKNLVDSIRCINIHSGYNPINRGWFPQVFSIINNLPIGATIHEMDEKLDHGLIIAREEVEKFVWDTSLTLYSRVLDKEIYLFEKYFDVIIENTYSGIKPESEGNIFSKADFNNLCEIDMNQVGSFNEFYNLLRALTHGEYKNAFFKTENDEKVYIKLEVKKNDN